MPALRSNDTSATQAPPQIVIASPTPRRSIFFPLKHNLAESPISTPSASPFEGDYDNRSSSSGPAVRAVNAARRQKKREEGYVKRPENAFILFRMNMCTQINATKPEGSKPNREADLSKTISKHWKELSPEEKQVWKDMAAEKKREHQQQYPDYKYRPNRGKKGSAGKSSSTATVSSMDDERDEDEYVPVAYSRSRSARRAAAPYPVSDNSSMRNGPFFKPVRASSAPEEHYPSYQEVSPDDMHRFISCPTSPQVGAMDMGFDYLSPDAAASPYDNYGGYDLRDIGSSVGTASTGSASPQFGGFIDLASDDTNSSYEYDFLNMPITRGAEMELDNVQHFLPGWPEDVGAGHTFPSDAEFELVAAQMLNDAGYQHHEYPETTMTTQHDDPCVDVARLLDGSRAPQTDY